MAHAFPLAQSLLSSTQIIRNLRNAMLVFPNIKINLGLFVTGKRPDGYHNIESVFYPVHWRESLEITDRVEEAFVNPAIAQKAEVDHMRFMSYGIDIPGDPAENLCIKVYQLLCDWYNLPPFDLHLLKTLPIGAGMGGGSADAAYALKAMKAFFNLSIADVEAMDLLAQVGSDCPFFWKNQPMFVFSRGERMRPINLNLADYFILIVNPHIHISTKEAYAGITPKDPLIDLELLPDIPVEQWRNSVVNDFEGALFVSHPILASLKQQLYDLGAIYASMTGSGSTLYGIFDRKVNAPAAWEQYTTWSGSLSLS